jgi:hypothetical protein
MVLTDSYQHYPQYSKKFAILYTQSTFRTEESICKVNTIYNDSQIYCKTKHESAVHHYRVTCKITDTCKILLHWWEVGMIWITLRGEKGVTKGIELTKT